MPRTRQRRCGYHAARYPARARGGAPTWRTGRPRPWSASWRAWRGGRLRRRGDGGLRRGGDGRLGRRRDGAASASPASRRRRADRRRAWVSARPASSPASTDSLGSDLRRRLVGRPGARQIGDGRCRLRRRLGGRAPASAPCRRAAVLPATTGSTTGVAGAAGVAAGFATIAVGGGRALAVVSPRTPNRSEDSRRRRAPAGRTPAPAHAG